MALELICQISKDMETALNWSRSHPLVRDFVRANEAGLFYRNKANGLERTNNDLEKRLAKITKAAGDIMEERARQISHERYDEGHDDSHDPGELVAAGAAYAINAADQLHPASQGDAHNAMPQIWPWSEQCWKPKEPRRDLVRAAALILAEIEKLDRAEKSGE